ncbi:MAG: GNAT family N-acetyltransferase [Hyphomicrobiaceae bacterium]
MTAPQSISPQPFLDPGLIADLCGERTFTAGERLRTKGLLSIDMFLLTRGEVEIDVGDAPATLIAGRGSPVGEIGFLTGVPATATVTARGDVSALYIDNGTWRAIAQHKPEVAIALHRQLAEIAEGRRSHNLLFIEGADATSGAAVDVVLCRDPDQLFEAQRMRYEVYCEELGRTSPNADKERRIIADGLDHNGHVLLALADGAPVATMRLNMSREGGLGLLEGLYGMAQHPGHPQSTGIVTKFIVRKEHRFSQAAFKMMATALEMAQRYAVKHCYIDCIPTLVPAYMALGFAHAAPAFLHPENGRSHPMRLDVDRYAKRVFRLAGLVAR